MSTFFEMVPVLTLIIQQGVFSPNFLVREMSLSLIEFPLVYWMNCVILLILPSL